MSTTIYIKINDWEPVRYAYAIGINHRQFYVQKTYLPNLMLAKFFRYTV